MKKYELINPSDKVYLQADDLKVAMIVCYILGGGMYALEDAESGETVMPIMILGIRMSEWIEENFNNEEGLLRFKYENILKIADCLDSVHTERERTSMNDISGRARKIANQFREIK